MVGRAWSVDNRSRVPVALDSRAFSVKSQKAVCMILYTSDCTYVIVWVWVSNLSETTAQAWPSLTFSQNYVYLFLKIQFLNA